MGDHGPTYDRMRSDVTIDDAQRCMAVVEDPSTHRNRQCKGFRGNSANSEFCPKHRIPQDRRHGKIIMLSGNQSTAQPSHGGPENSSTHSSSRLPGPHGTIMDRIYEEETSRSHKAPIVQQFATYRDDNIKDEDADMLDRSPQSARNFPTQHSPQVEERHRPGQPFSPSSSSGNPNMHPDHAATLELVNMNQTAVLEEMRRIRQTLEDVEQEHSRRLEGIERHLNPDLISPQNDAIAAIKEKLLMQQKAAVETLLNFREQSVTVKSALQRIRQDREAAEKDLEQQQRHVDELRKSEAKHEGGVECFHSMTDALGDFEQNVPDIVELLKNMGV